MPQELIDIQLIRHNRQPWGFRLIGGRDEGLVLKIEKVRLRIKVHQLFVGEKLLFSKFSPLSF